MYQPISSLNLPEFKVQELQTMGYHYCNDIDKLNENFCSRVNITEWNNVTNVPKTKSALELYQEECISGTILTCNQQLDEALGGGIAVGLITEFCGEPGCGKTQICMHLCVNVQLPTWCGGLAGQAVYIDTNKGFASHRLREIATMCVNNYISFKTKHSIKTAVCDKEFNVEAILMKIHFIGIDDYVELIALVKYIEKWLQEHSSVRLVIIDNISAPLKLVSSQERTQITHNIFKDLQILSQKYQFAIVVTNNITTRINSANSTYHTPSLGGSYYHRINVRVELSKKSANVFTASIVKNVLQPPSTVEFTLFC